MAFRKKTNQDMVETVVPKLDFNKMVEITKLYRLYGSVNKILAYWGMVKLDEKENIIAICNYEEQSAFSSEKYYAFEPLKGINYSQTIIPYEFGKEWVAKWALWIENRYRDGDKSIADLVFKGKFENRMVK